MNVGITLTRLLLLAVASAMLAAPVAAQEVVLRGTLSGDNVMSATESEATGEVAAVLTEDDVLRLDLVFAGLELGATGAALHTGSYNANGPLVERLDIDTGATEGRITGAEMSLTPLTAAAVRAGDSYVVISTVEYPDGAVRAQLMPQPVRLDSPVVEPVTAPPPYEPVPVEEPEEEEDDE